MPERPAAARRAARRIAGNAGPAAGRAARLADAGGLPVAACTQGNADRRGGTCRLIAGTGAATYLVARHDLSSMRRIPDPFMAIPAAARPPLPTGSAARDVTFLVGGLDTRSPVPTTGAHASSDAAGRTDTLMLVHLIAGGRGAYVVSIPRDSWVPIPGHGDGKINWAYFFGGPRWRSARSSTLPRSASTISRSSTGLASAR